MLGVATTAQMGAAAIGIGAQSGAGLVLALSGCVLFLAVAGLLAWRFRAINGVWVGGLLARSVLGMTTTASGAYAAPFAFAVWAAMSDLDWLAVLLSVVGGTAYAVVARRWWSAYRRDPAAHAEGGTMTMVGTLALVTAAGMIVLVGLAR